MRSEGLLVLCAADCREEYGGNCSDQEQQTNPAVPGHTSSGATPVPWAPVARVPERSVVGLGIGQDREVAAVDGGEGLAVWQGPRAFLIRLLRVHRFLDLFPDVPVVLAQRLQIGRAHV